MFKSFNKIFACMKRYVCHRFQIASSSFLHCLDSIRRNMGLSSLIQILKHNPKLGSILSRYFPFHFQKSIGKTLDTVFWKHKIILLDFLEQDKTTPRIYYTDLLKKLHHKIQTENCQQYASTHKSLIAFMKLVLI